ncbi:hypothetical protein [Methanolobus vulcani]|uniref:hypothetical protein n=1 Tax=Methanolobus vulcani TaxID=38026 RepID=UPI0018ACA436|nr:hypothetical protein [Methanolobus vulcani]
MLLRELIYGLLPYSVHQKIVSWKCKFEKQDNNLIENHLALYPPSLDINKVVRDDLDKCVAFLPYCAKPLGDHACPVSDREHKRKNQKCIKVSGGKCTVPCSLGNMVDILLKHGFTKDQIFIIDRDSNLFPWLKQKRAEGYEYFMPGTGCKYGVSYALDYIGGKLGYKGCIAFVDDFCPEDKDNGVCKCMNDYLAMEGIDKGKRTKVHEGTVLLMDRILSGNYQGTKADSNSSLHKNELPSGNDHSAFHGY